DQDTGRAVPECSREAGRTIRWELSPMLRVFWFVGCLAVFPCGCAERAAPSAKSAVERGPPLICTIRADSMCALGQSPKVNVEITNNTDNEIYLVGSLDSSDCEWRFPHCIFEVIGPDGKSSVRELGRCGNMNPLREKDFVKVP